MRLIDADALEQELFDADWMLDNDEHMVQDIIEKQPAIDAVTVVRCKDCCYNSGLASGDGWCKDDIVCSYHMSDGFEDNDFCSRGERYEAD